MHKNACPKTEAHADALEWTGAGVYGFCSLHSLRGSSKSPLQPPPKKRCTCLAPSSTPWSRSLLSRRPLSGGSSTWPRRPRSNASSSARKKPRTGPPTPPGPMPEGRPKRKTDFRLDPQVNHFLAPSGNGCIKDTQNVLFLFFLSVPGSLANQVTQQTFSSLAF